MKLQTSTTFFQTLKDKFLLVDTSFFGDYSTYPKEFSEFLKKLKINQTTITTTSSVKIEYVKGFNNETRNKDNIKARFDLVETVVDKVLDDSEFIKTELIKSTLDFYIDNKGKVGNTIGNASVTDLLLASAKLANKDNIFLLSKNYNDFPLEVVEHISIYKGNKIETYAIY